jgi:eukaryotic-like serine/threonine-protein kinase
VNPQRPGEGSAPGADIAASAIDSSVAPEMVAAHGLRRYALHDEIASGRIATVYLGRLLGPHGFARTVAIKRVRSQFMRDAELAAMLFEGARLAGRVRHPNVIATLDVVSGDDLLVVMEYVHGESLATLLRTLRGRGVLAPLPIASALLVGVLRGLHAVHDARRASGEGAQGDASPAPLASLASSVLVGTDGLPRLFDLGVGRASAWAGSSRVADLFAASALLWEVLAGRPLLPRVTPEGFEPPSRYRPDLSPAIDAVVARGLDPSPATRFASAAEMADALEAEVRAAPAFEIGAWVTSLAMPALAERARLLATIEGVPAPARAIAETLPPADGVRDTPVASPVDPKEAVTRRTRSVPPPPAIETTPPSAFDPPISIFETPPSSILETPPPSIFGTPPPPRRVPSRAAVLAAIGAATALALVGLRHLSSGPRAPASAVVATVAPQPPATPSVVDVPPTAETPEVATAPTAAPPSPLEHVRATPAARAAPSHASKATRPHPAATRNDVL